MNISPILRLIAVSLFIGVMGLPLFFLPFGSSDDVLASELRAPARPPVTPRTWVDFMAWPRDAEKYLVDQFHGRADLIRWNSRLRYACGDSSAARVLVGRDGWLFLSKDEAINTRHRGVISFTRAELDAWLDGWRERADFSGSAGAALVLVVAPDKQSVYTDRMPYGFHPVRMNLMDQLAERTGSVTSLRLLDLRPALRQARTQCQTYPRYDTHWTDEGMLVAYHKIMDAVEPLVASQRILPPAYTFRPASRPGDLARMLALPDLVDTLPTIVFNPDRLKVTRQPDFEVTAANGWRIASGLSGRGRVLVLCDSYVMATPVMTLLANSFSETWFLHHRRCQFPRPLVEQFKPDLILYIVAERQIPIVLRK